MVCFEVLRNGEVLYRAGAGAEGSLSAYLHWLRYFSHAQDAICEESFLWVAGDRAGNHVDWGQQHLAIGDEVTIRIIECEQPDPVVGYREPVASRLSEDQLAAIRSAAQSRRLQISMEEELK